MTVLSKRCIQALKYYARETDEYYGMPKDSDAYNTLNALLYDDVESEKARAKEGKRLNPAFLDMRPGVISALCADLITACMLGGKGAPAETLFRVARRSDVETMMREGRTLSFTSTSKNGFLDSYVDKDGLVLLEIHLPENAPRAELAALLPDYSKPKEAEVLLPPWLTANFETCALSEAESQIRDCTGCAPLAKYRVYIGDSIVPPEFGKDTPIEIPPAEPGKRVLAALMSGNAPEPKDVETYLLWKKALCAEIVTENSLRTLLQVYAESMESVRYIAENTPDDLFDATQGKAWIKSLLGVADGSSFAKRIDHLPDVRVTHTITTFLLGIWLRDNLHLGFNNLPRIFSRNNKVGDPFPFFWAVVCLSHDIGYLYEADHRLELFQELAEEWDTGNSALPKLQKLLGLHAGKTLLQLERGDLKAYGLTDEECDWAERSIRMAWKYYGYRLNQKKEDLKTAWSDPIIFREHYRGRIDHGITGGMVLYDVLHEMASKRKTGKTVTRHTETGKTGFAAANFGHSRFLACGILVALTVARHNMFVVDAQKNDDDKNPLARYKDHTLDELIVDGENNKLSIHESLDQLLFFLDYLDTIDPFKAFYMQKGLSSDERDKWGQFVTRRIWLGYCRGRSGGNHRIHVRFDTLDFELDSKGAIKKYKENIGKMQDWLLLSQSPTGMHNSLNLYMPVIERRSWKDYYLGITDEEILDICFYQGVPDSSRPGAFYRTPNAYQSLNLLMMDGLNGERIRIGEEKQRPNSIYIRDWKRTLSLFRNIFSALCKCRSLQADEFGVLHRMDRWENVKQIIKAGRTIAFTSTTKTAFLPEFLKGKIDPVIETVRLSEAVPAFDFQRVLCKDYAFTDEAEVLLPPFVKLCDPPRPPLESEKEGAPITLELALGSMDFPSETTDSESLRQTLQAYRDEAAKTLDLFVSDADSAFTVADEGQYHAYLEWKRAFQALVAIELRDIYNP